MDQLHGQLRGNLVHSIVQDDISCQNASYPCICLPFALSLNIADIFGLVSALYLWGLWKKIQRMIWPQVEWLYWINCSFSCEETWFTLSCRTIFLVRIHLTHVYVYHSPLLWLLLTYLVLCLNDILGILNKIQRMIWPQVEPLYLINCSVCYEESLFTASYQENVLVNIHFTHLLPIAGQWIWLSKFDSQCSA